MRRLIGIKCLSAVLAFYASGRDQEGELMEDENWKEDPDGARGDSYAATHAGVIWYWGQASHDSVS